MISADFFGRDKLTVIGLVANGGFCLREIAKNARLAPSSAHKILSSLKKNKMVRKTRKKNKTFFFINYSSPLAREAVRVAAVSQLLHSNGLKNFLRLKPKRVYLFGSAVNGRLSPSSDLDIAAFFSSKPDMNLVRSARKKLSAEFGREIDLFILNEKSSSSMDEKTVTIKSIENSILLYGDERLVKKVL